MAAQVADVTGGAGAAAVPAAGGDPLTAAVPAGADISAPWPPSPFWPPAPEPSVATAGSPYWPPAPAQSGSTEAVAKLQDMAESVHRAELARKLSADAATGLASDALNEAEKRVELEGLAAAG